MRPGAVLFLDLDGPVLDCKVRHYTCYADLCAERGLRALERDDYWELKRGRTAPRDIFRKSGAGDGEGDLQQAWVARVEEPRYLALDTVHAGVHEVLASWVEAEIRLVLATLRRNRSGLHHELARLDVARFFERIAASDPALGAEGKAREAAQSVPGAELGASIWIGDTEVDAIAAQRLGCARLFLVTSGIREGAYLRSLRAGEVVTDLRAASELLAGPG